MGDGAKKDVTDGDGTAEGMGDGIADDNGEGSIEGVAEGVDDGISWAFEIWGDAKVVKIMARITTILLGMY